MRLMRFHVHERGWGQGMAERAARRRSVKGAYDVITGVSSKAGISDVRRCEKNTRTDNRITTNL